MWNLVFEIQYTDQEGGSLDVLLVLKETLLLDLVAQDNTKVKKYDSGYSFNVPTQEAYDAFKEGDARREVTVF